MSILINGIGMPTGENNLLCIISPDGSIQYKLHSEKQWHNGNAIELPPHGRLIDADELMKRKGNCYDADGHLLYAVGTGSIMCAPTIIPAEEGE